MKYLISINSLSRLTMLTCWYSAPAWSWTHGSHWPEPASRGSTHLSAESAARPSHTHRVQYVTADNGASAVFYTTDKRGFPTGSRTTAADADSRTTATPGQYRYIILTLSHFILKL